MKFPFLIAATSCLACQISLATETSLVSLQQRIVGHWTSISCEIRPQPNPADPALAPQPTYLTRDFRYDAKAGFEASITVYADAACEHPAATYDFAGELVWHGANPAADGAWSQDYVLNRALSLTVRLPAMVDQLNGLPEGACGEGPFVLNETRDILGKPCALSRFVEGRNVVVDHDFLYVRADTPNLLFMGAKHVDGTGFYLPEHRPRVGLQQPLIRAD